MFTRLNNYADDKLHLLSDRMSKLISAEISAPEVYRKQNHGLNMHKNDSEAVYKKFRQEEEKEFIAQLKEIKVDGIWNRGKSLDSFMAFMRFMCS